MIITTQIKIKDKKYEDKPSHLNFLDWPPQSWDIGLRKFLGVGGVNSALLLRVFE